MKTSKPELKDVELTTLEAWGAYMALRPLSTERLPVRAALTVRRLHRALQPIAEDRDELIKQVLEDCAIPKGEGYEIDEQGEIMWDDPDGADRVEEINDAPVNLTVAPLNMSALVSDVVSVSPAVLVQLEDAGLLVDDITEE